MTETEQQIIAFVEGRLAPRIRAAALSRSADTTTAASRARARRARRRRRGCVHVSHPTRFRRSRRPARRARGVVKLASTARRRVPADRRLSRALRSPAARQPDWLDVDLNWLEQYVIPEAGGLAGPELEEWLKNRLLALFRCVAEPPEWIQDPDWPINENGPLVFLGQLSVFNYFHDEAAAYVFHDPTTGACETIVQVF